MTDLLLQMLLGVTLGLAFVWLARRPACRVFGAAPAFTLWLLPVLMAFAPLLPRSFVISNTWALPAITATARALPADIPSASSFPLAWLPIAIWAAGASVAFCRLALQYLRVLRAIAPMPQAWRAMIAETAPELRASRVRVHEAGPAVLWAWRTRVLLPPDFDTRFDNTAQRLVLHHELTHVRRGDALWLLIAELACAVLWFHPLAWLALPRFRLDQELACDERTLRSLKEGAVHYARALLDSVAVQVLPALIPWLAEPQLKERIAMISNKRPGALRRRFGFFAVAAILTSGLLIAGGQTPVQAAAKQASNLIYANQTKTAAAVESNPASAPPSVDATFKNRLPPHYPAEAIHKGEQGTVILDVTVDAAGNVKGVQIDEAKTNAPMSLQTISIQAAANWRFKPGYSDGKPVGGTVEVPVNFSLTHDLKPCPSGQAHDPKPPFQCVPEQPATKSS